MSAAEKLRTLDERTQIAYTTEAFIEIFQEVERVLPLIVAVVEAAERVDARKDEEAWRFRPARMRDLRAVLAALDAALTVDGKESAGELRDEGIHDAFDANQWD